MSTQESKSTVGGTHPDQEACNQLLKDLITSFSLGPSTDEIFETLEQLFLTYFASDVVEANDRADRDRIVTCYIEVKRLIKRVETYNRMCKFTMTSQG